jgi:hypothetical protein
MLAVGQIAADVIAGCMETLNLVVFELLIELAVIEVRDVGRRQNQLLHDEEHHHDGRDYEENPSKMLAHDVYLNTLL